MKHDAVALAQKIIQFKSLNPPGHEKECSDFISAFLVDAGFEVKAYEFAPDRPTLIARIQGTEKLKPLCFTGHIDVVPLGSAEWRFPPFAAEISDGRLYGRGASDMKAGVAAFIAAAANVLDEARDFRRGVTMVITAGEETGCEGAFHVGREGVLGEAELLVVAEPTSNAPVFAHKGSLRVIVSATGRTAHSSMPEEGENAIEKVAHWIDQLTQHEFPGRHPLLGSTTACVTTIEGGENINSVPDFARFTVDFRTIPEQSHDHLLAHLAGMFGPMAKIEVVTSFPGFSTDPSDASAGPLLDLLEKRTGTRAKLAGAPYFTDASALVPAFDNAATVVIGPGEAAQCHKTDEFCFVDRIVESQSIYTDLIRSMCL